MLYADGQIWASIAAFGKQPLPFWLFGTLGNILNNPLIGGRLVTFIISIPLFFVLYEIMLSLSADKRIAKLALIIFATSPLFILFQSLALMDGFLLSIAGGIFLLLTREKIESYSQSIYLGLLVVLALWVKNNGVVVMFLALTTYLALISHKCRGNLREIIKRFAPCIILIIIGTLPLTLRDDFVKLVGESDQFTFTIAELLKLPVSAWANNLLYVCVSMLFYFGPIFYALFIPGIIKAKISRKLLLSLWILVPIGFSIFSIKDITVRYFLFGTLFLVPLAAYNLDYFASLFPRKRGFLTALISILLIIQSVIFVFFPQTYFGFIPKKTLIERERHYAFTNGLGTRKAVSAIRDNVRQAKHIYVGVEDRQGNPSDYVLADFYYSRSVEVFFLSTEKELREISKGFGEYPLYYVARGSAIPSDLSPYLILLRKYEEYDRSDYVGLFQIDTSNIDN